jgi:hypothetical protein
MSQPPIKPIRIACLAPQAIHTLSDAIRFYALRADLAINFQFPALTGFGSFCPVLSQNVCAGIKESEVKSEKIGD